MLRLLILLSAVCFLTAAEPIRALLIDGQNNHDWKATTPVLKRQLEETGLFRVDVITTPAKGADMSGFLPNFKEYQRGDLKLQWRSVAGLGQHCL